MLSGCATTSQSGPNLAVVAQDDGSEQDSTPPSGDQPPTLDQLESFAPDDSDTSAKEQARLQQVQQVALEYGLQGGLAQGIAQIDQIVKSNSDYLTRTYDFGALMIDGPYGSKILPPVIVESDKIYDQVNDSTLVIADHSYQILTPAAFAPIQPLWQTYLIMPWVPPATPDAKDFPDKAIEHKAWDAALKKGYPSAINWNGIGFGELRVSVWWKYDHSKHPQANLSGSSKEEFRTSRPLAKPKDYPKFVCVVVSAWLERKTGQHIQGIGHERLFDIYTRQSEKAALDALPEVTPNGYKAEGKFFF